jgi:dUTP pyrophosphatase
MEVKVKKVAPEASIPKYAKNGDAGLDLVAISKTTVESEDGKSGYIELDSGLAFEIPTGYVGLVFPRSSISNTGAILSNSVGVIDSGYRGTVKARFKQIKDTKEYEIGDKFVQLIIIPYPKITLIETDNLSESERGMGGYGSTGK